MNKQINSSRNGADKGMEIAAALNKGRRMLSLFGKILYCITHL